MFRTFGVQPQTLGLLVHWADKLSVAPLDKLPPRASVVDSGVVKNAGANKSKASVIQAGGAYSGSDAK